MIKKKRITEEEMPLHYVKKILKKSVEVPKPAMLNDLGSFIRKQNSRIDEVIDFILEKFEKSYLKAMKCIYVTNCLLNIVPGFSEHLQGKWVPCIYEQYERKANTKGRPIGELIRMHALYLKKRMEFSLKYGYDSLHPESSQKVVDNEKNFTIITHLAERVNICESILHVKTKSKNTTTYYPYLTLVGDTLNYLSIVSKISYTVLETIQNKKEKGLKLYHKEFTRFTSVCIKLKDFFIENCKVTPQIAQMEGLIKIISDASTQIKIVIQNKTGIPFVQDDCEYEAIMNLSDKKSPDDDLFSNMFLNDSQRISIYIKHGNFDQNNQTNLDQKAVQEYETALDLMRHSEKDLSPNKSISQAQSNKYKNKSQEYNKNQYGSTSPNKQVKSDQYSQSSHQRNYSDIPTNVHQDVNFASHQVLGVEAKFQQMSVDGNRQYLDRKNSSEFTERYNSQQHAGNGRDYSDPQSTNLNYGRNMDDNSSLQQLGNYKNKQNMAQFQNISTSTQKELYMPVNNYDISDKTKPTSLNKYSMEQPTHRANASSQIGSNFNYSQKSGYNDEFGTTASSSFSNPQSGSSAPLDFDPYKEFRGYPPNSVRNDRSREMNVNSSTFSNQQNSFAMILQNQKSFEIPNSNSNEHNFSSINSSSSKDYFLPKVIFNEPEMSESNKYSSLNYNGGISATFDQLSPQFNTSTPGFDLGMSTNARLQDVQYNSNKSPFDGPGSKDPPNFTGFSTSQNSQAISNSGFSNFDSSFSSHPSNSGYQVKNDPSSFPFNSNKPNSGMQMDSSIGYNRDYNNPSSTNRTNGGSIRNPQVPNDKMFENFSQTSQFSQYPPASQFPQNQQTGMNSKFSGQDKSSFGSQRGRGY